MRAPDGKGPDFLCIGLQKAGTQWLYDQLRPHADFWMPPVKELRYFFIPPEQRTHLRRIRGNWDKLRNWNRRDLAYLTAVNWISWRTPDIDEYARLFNLKGEKLTGDITPEFSLADDALIEIMSRRLPSIRIVLIVRDPVERFWSALSMGVRNRVHSPVQTDEDWHRVRQIAEDPIVRGLSYPSQIAARWSKYFAPDKFGAFLFDDLVADPAAFRARVIRFLGGDPDKRSGNLPPSFNRKALHPKLDMSAAYRERLSQYFADEIHACAAAFGGAAISWPAKYGL
jgi:hypothetical protein